MDFILFVKSVEMLKQKKRKRRKGDFNWLKKRVKNVAEQKKILCSTLIKMDRKHSFVKIVH